MSLKYQSDLLSLRNRTIIRGGHDFSIRLKESCSRKNKFFYELLQKIVLLVGKLDLVEIAKVLKEQAAEFAIELNELGLTTEAIESRSSIGLKYLACGKEAIAWLDESTSEVYKLVRLGENKDGGIQAVSMSEWDIKLQYSSLSFLEIVEKACLLNEIGGCPTEIVGLSIDGKFLIIKQLYCLSIGLGIDSQREKLFKIINAVLPNGNFGMGVRVCWGFGKGWFLADFHSSNVLMLNGNRPVLIDASFGEISTQIQMDYPHVARSVGKAKNFVEHKTCPDDLFYEVRDDDL